MQINQSYPELQISLSPDDCTLLANACRIAADETSDRHSRRHIGGGKEISYMFFLMACTLDGFARVADAPSRFSNPADRAGFDLATIAREWSPLPQKEG